MVHAVRHKYPNTFKVDLRPAVEHDDELRLYELGDHGVICLGPGDEILWKHPGHNMTQEALDAVVQHALAVLEKH